MFAKVVILHQLECDSNSLWTTPNW